MLSLAIRPPSALQPIRWSAKRSAASSSLAADFRSTQSDGKIVGGLGLSGDTSCTDHVIAWKVRHELHLDAVPMGPSPDHNDNMILDFHNGVSQSGFGHPSCKGGTQSDGIISDLSKDFPTGPRAR